VNFFTIDAEDMDAVIHILEKTGFESRDNPLFLKRGPQHRKS